MFLAIFLAPLFVALGDSSVWDANEAFYVQTPREMIDSGDWLVPSFNGRPRLNKPPLAYWIVAALYEMFGVSILWERLAMALLAAGSILAVLKMGRRLFNPDTALLAAGIFATTFRFVILSRRLLIDILLLFCLMAAIACLLEWIAERQHWQFLLAIIFVGLGFLAKGPLAFFPLAWLALHLAVTGQLRVARQAPWVLGALLLAGICLPWFLVLGSRDGWESVVNFFVRENLGRFANLDYGPKRGLFYYCGVFLADFFPWSIIFPAASWWWWRTGRAEAGSRRQTKWLLLLWMAIWFVVFSFSRNKQEYYILPIYPAAALWTARYLHQRVPGRLFGLAVGIPLVAAAGGLYLVAARLFPGTPWLWLPSAALVTFPFWAARRDWSMAAASLSLFFAFGFAVYLGPLEEFRPVRPLARAIAALESKKGETMAAGYFRFTAPSLAFYLNRPIAEIYDLDKASQFLKINPFAGLIVESKDLAELRAASEVPLRVVASRPLLSTNSRTLWKAVRSGEPLESSVWTREIALVTQDRP